MKILFVENHQEFAVIVIESFLSDHEVTLTPSLVDARSHLLKSTFDLILVDYDLDDGKGDELVSELRSSDASDCRVIAVSAREEGNERMLESGADAICGKMEFDTIAKVIQLIM